MRLVGWSRARGRLGGLLLHLKQLLGYDLWGKSSVGLGSYGASGSGWIRSIDDTGC